jgi:hypothetical protein
MLSGEAANINLTLPLLTEVPVPSQESKRHVYVCLGY